MNRLTRDEWGIKLALVTSQRSTCLSRQVGCVLLDQRGHVLSTGYNGAAAGMEHCTKCKREDTEPGKDLDNCYAIHAEQNALLQCKDVNKIHTAYVTTSPCITCLKILLNTSCKCIVSVDQYLNNSDSKKLWFKAGRDWKLFNKEDL